MTLFSSVLQMPQLCFTSITPLLTNRFSTSHLSKHQLSYTSSQKTQHVKRRRRALVMKEIDGGAMPDFSSEGAQEVQYFSKATEPIVPDKPLSSDSSKVSELPLFPLQLVMNPGTSIPLHIFEMRYRMLFNRVREGDSRFGIVLYDSKSNSLALIGCAAELTRFESLPDGRIMTNNIGRQRFRILNIIDEKPYTRAMVEFLRDDPPKENLSKLESEVWQALQDVLRLSNKLYDKVLDLSADIKRLAPDGEESNKQNEEEDVPEGWPSPKRLEDFSFSVCQVLDMPLKEQQILLQIQDTGVRLKRQLKMLTTARQYLAAQVTIKEAGLKEL